MKHRDYNRRQYTRFEVALPAQLFAPYGAILVRVEDLSLGGAKVRLYSSMPHAIEEEVHSIALDHFGVYPCEVVARLDRVFRLSFLEDLARGSDLGKFLARQAHPRADGT